MSPMSDEKHTQRLTIWLTESEEVDLMRMAASQDRKCSEMGRVAIRRFMYGFIGPEGDSVHVANGANTRTAPRSAD